MNTAKLQVKLDQALATSRQRWMLMIIAVLSITLASAAIARATPFTDTWVVYCVVVIAMVVAADPSEQLGLVLMSIVLFQSITAGQAVTSPWALALAVALHVFHSVVALMSVTPHSATVHQTIVIRWIGRSAVVLLITVGVWLLVVAFERRELPGNVTLSMLAFAVLVAAVVGFAARTLPANGGDSADQTS